MRMNTWPRWLQKVFLAVAALAGGTVWGLSVAMMHAPMWLILSGGVVVAVFIFTFFGKEDPD